MFNFKYKYEQPLFCSLPSFHYKILTSLLYDLKYVNFFRNANLPYFSFSYFWKRSIMVYYTVLSTPLTIYFFKANHHEEHCCIPPNDHDTQQIWLNYLQGGDRELHMLLKYVQIKQTLKICSFGLVWLFFRWNLSKNKGCTLLCGHVMKLNAWPKKHFPKKNLQSLHFQRIISRKLVKY